jgi:hypothetical protein
VSTQPIQNAGMPQGVDFVGKTVTPVRVVDKYTHKPTFRCFLGYSVTVLGVGILKVLTTEPVNAKAGIAALTRL